MDPSDLNSYRPISNLSYVSKLLERIIDSRFTEHANTNNLFSPLQSAYRKHHSTVKIHNDLITNIDQGLIGALVLLDLSSAFDKVDHSLLLPENPSAPFFSQTQHSNGLALRNLPPSVRPLNVGADIVQPTSAVRDLLVFS